MPPDKTKNSRRNFLKTSAAASVGVGAAASARPLFSAGTNSSAEEERPNIILAMADDLSWNGMGYIGVLDTPITPNLDKMSTECLRFDRFYACPVCSPARAGCLTGRYPSREGVMTGGKMEVEGAITLPEILSAHGYTTGHFGKWHLGGGEGMHPLDRGYSEALWTGNNVRHVDPDRYKRNYESVGVIEGDDSEILANEVLAFAQRSKEQGKPFFATLWFHAPHSPQGSSQKYRDLYPPDQNRLDQYSDISAVDGGMGILREGLKNLGLTENTMLWFTSDNGRYPWPEVLRGSKGTLYEGGIRVPGLLEWPTKVKDPRLTTIPAGIFDFLPTILDYLNISTDKALSPLDGISLRSLIDGTWEERPKPLAFQWNDWESTYDPKTSTYALVDNDIKFMITPEGDALYDLVQDIKEKENIIDQHPDKATEMKTYLEDWIVSMENSLAGEDYKGTGVVFGKERLDFPTNYRFSVEAGHLVIRSNRLLSGTLRAELLSADGRTIKRWEQTSLSGRMVRLGIPAPARGTYMVRLLQPGGKDIIEKVTVR